MFHGPISRESTVSEQSGWDTADILNKSHPFASGVEAMAISLFSAERCMVFQVLVVEHAVRGMGVAV